MRNHPTNDRRWRRCLGPMISRLERSILGGMSCCINSPKPNRAFTSFSRSSQCPVVLTHSPGDVGKPHQGNPTSDLSLKTYYEATQASYRDTRSDAWTVYGSMKTRLSGKQMRFVRSSPSSRQALSKIFGVRTGEVLRAGSSPGSDNSPVLGWGMRASGASLRVVRLKRFQARA